MIRKLLSVLVVFHLMLSVSFGQKGKAYYYDKKGNECSFDSADWIRQFHIVDSIHDIWLGADLYKGGSTKSTAGYYVREDRVFYPADSFTTYYKTGDVECTGRYLYDYPKKIRGEKYGRWKWYYNDGTLKCEYQYTVDSNYTDQYLINYWDAAGKHQVIDGQGTCSYTERGFHYVSQYKNGHLDGELTIRRTNGKLFCQEQYSNGKLERGESYDTSGKKYTYDKFDENPQFPGGDAALMSFLQKNIKYPKYERNNNIQGKVLLHVVIDYSGNVEDVTVRHSVTKGLDNEAVRVVKLLPKFTPGKRRGQVVNVPFNLPIVFRLE